MSNIRQALIENIESDLRKITTGNGYNNTVFDVKRMHIWEQQVSVFPTVWFEIQNEQKNTGINEDETYFYNTINLLIGGYVKTSNDLSLTGVVVNEAENLLQDIYDCVEKRKPQSFTIDQISYIEPAHVKGIYPYITGKNNVVGVVVEVEIQYLQSEDASNINVTKPIAPTLSSPSNGGTSTTLYTQFDWASVSDAVSYHIQVGTDAGYNSTIINQDYLIENSYTIPLDKVLTNGNTYYWKVRSFNQYGYSDWSSTYSFSVNASTTPVAPSLISPTGGLTSTLTATDFHWTVSDNSTSYDIIVSSASNFSVTSFSSSAINATTTTANLSANTTYWWKVRGRNSGGVGDYSSTGSFVRNADAQDYRTNLIVDWISDNGISASAGLVSSWVDTVSGLTMSQSSNSLKPLHNINQLNGHNVIQFLTNVPYMTFPATQFGTYTIFAVVNPSVHTSGDGNVLLGGTAGDIYTSLRLVNAGYGSGDATLLRNSVYSGSATATGWGIYTFQAQKVYKNNTEATYAYTQNPATITLNVLGARNISKTFPWYGQIAEIRIYNAVLDATSIGIVNNYLNNKYNIY